MYHADEPTRKYIEQEWDALQIPSSHIKMVSLPPRNHGEPHTSISGDHSTPLDENGQPAYLPIWKELFGMPSGK